MNMLSMGNGRPSPVSMNPRKGAFRFLWWGGNKEQAQTPVQVKPNFAELTKRALQEVEITDSGTKLSLGSYAELDEGIKVDYSNGLGSCMQTMLRMKLRQPAEERPAPDVVAKIVEDTLKPELRFLIKMANGGSPEERSAAFEALSDTLRYACNADCVTWAVKEMADETAKMAERGASTDGWLDMQRRILGYGARTNERSDIRTIAVDAVAGIDGSYKELLEIATRATNEEAKKHAGDVLFADLGQALGTLVDAKAFEMLVAFELRDELPIPVESIPQVLIDNKRLAEIKDLAHRGSPAVQAASQNALFVALKTTEEKETALSYARTLLEMGNTTILKPRDMDILTPAAQQAIVDVLAQAGNMGALEEYAFNYPKDPDFTKYAKDRLFGLHARIVMSSDNEAARDSSLETLRLNGRVDEIKRIAASADSDAAKEKAAAVLGDLEKPAAKQAE